MERSVHLVLFLLFLTFASLAQRPSTVEVVFPPDRANKEFYFRLPLTTGEYFNGNYVKARANADGVVTFKLKLVEPGIVMFSTSSFELIEIYVLPGERTKVQVGEKTVFSGAAKGENETLRSLKRYGVAHAVGNTKLLPVEVTNLLRLTNGRAVLDSLVAYIKRDQSILRENAAKFKLSKDFVDFLSIDIEFYYRDIVYAAIENKFANYMYIADKRDSAFINSYWGESLKKIFDTKIEDQELVRKSEWYYNHLFNEMYSYHGSFLKEETNPDNQSAGGLDSWLSFNFENGIPQIAERELSAAEREIFMPNFLSRYITGNTTFYTNAMVSCFNMFKQEFPASRYLPLLEKKMQSVISYARASVDETKSSPYVRLLKSEELSSYDEILSKFKGKVLLIDFWATWCGPCLEEFEDIGKTNKLQRENSNVVVLFISRDNPDDTQKWEKAIRLKNIEGYHIIGGPSLTNELRNKFDINAIPRSIIIGKDSQVITDDAPRFSSSELIPMLSRYAK